MSGKAEGSVVVEVPVEVVYARWTRFEEFPRFMGGVSSVHFLTDTRLSWVAELNGIRRKGEVEVLELVPQEKVSWAGTGEAVNSGTVTLKETEQGHTQVHLALEYELDDEDSASESGVNVVTNPAEKDLQRFKELLEASGDESEAWSGTFEGEPGEPTG